MDPGERERGRERRCECERGIRERDRQRGCKCEREGASVREERETERERNKRLRRLRGERGDGGYCEIKEEQSDSHRLIYIAVISVVIKIGVWHEQRK